MHLHQTPLLSAKLPHALVYRAFTATGWENFTGDVAGERPDMPYTGPDGTERGTVAGLIADAGPRPVWLGADAQDALDGAARLWFTLALGRGLGRRLAFRVLTDSPEEL